MPEAGISITFFPETLHAILPLLEGGLIEVLEWSPDLSWNHELPSWGIDILDTFAASGNLLVHGVTYSLLSGSELYHRNWCERIQRSLDRFPARHLTEHYGFAMGSNFHQSPPLPMPITETIVIAAQRNGQLLMDYSRIPVGFENLAFAFSRYDLEGQVKLLNQVNSQLKSFLLLDLHNLYCQMENFGIGAEEILQLYTAQNVIREIHVSGDRGVRALFLASGSEFGEILTIIVFLIRYLSSLKSRWGCFRMKS